MIQSIFTKISPPENEAIAVSLIVSSEKDISKIEYILLIDDTVHDYSNFVTSSNETTFTIVYNYNSTKEELKTIFQEKISICSIKRLGFVFHDAQLSTKCFLDNELLFSDDDLLQTDGSSYSNNLKCIIELLNTYNIGNIDYLACNTLQYDNWNKYYDIIEKETRTIKSRKRRWYC